MNLRFFKKLNGEKILQQYDPAKCDYVDVPMVEESLKERLLNEIHKDKYRGCTLTILISKNAHERLKMEHNGLYSPAVEDITSIYGHRVYITNMIPDFKILKEL